MLKIKGHIPVKVTARSKEGSLMVISYLLYFVEGLNRTYFLKDALEQLRINPKNFPEAGAAAIEGRPTEDNDHTDDPASSEARVVGGVFRVSPSWDSLPPSTTTCKLGSKGPREPSSRCKL